MAFVQENLSQKTFVAGSPEELDKLCNEFKDKHPVRFSQSNPRYDFHKKKMLYISTLFYLEGDIPKPVSVPKKKNKKKVKKPNGYRDDREIKVPEEKARWTNCLECNGRWKWTHYKMCPGKHGIEALPEEYRERYREIWGMDNGNEEINQ